MPIWPIQQLGSTGEDVTTVQQLLTAQGFPLVIDAVFGPSTATAVSSFQTANGLVSDGIVGDLTWPALLVVLAAGASGAAVRGLQGQLRSQGWRLATDGVFGPAVTAAVRDFQRARGLVGDGVSGPQTWHSLIADFTRLATPELAASHLFPAWGARDRVLALTGATQAAVDLVLRGARGDLAAFGCVPDATLGPGHFICGYGFEGGGVNFQIRGDATQGYYVESASFFVD